MQTANLVQHSTSLSALLELVRLARADTRHKSSKAPYARCHTTGHASKLATVISSLINEEGVPAPAPRSLRIGVPSVFQPDRQRGHAQPSTSRATLSIGLLLLGGGTSICVSSFSSNLYYNPIDTTLRPCARVSTAEEAYAQCCFCVLGSSGCEDFASVPYYETMGAVAAVPYWTRRAACFRDL